MTLTGTTPTKKTKKTTYRLLGDTLQHLCSGCDKWKAANTTVFVNERGAKHGIGAYCRTCNSQKMNEWRADNKVKAAAQSTRYVTRIRNNPGELSKADHETLLDLCGDRCLDCGLSSILVGKLEPDHIIPGILGGSNDISNRQMLCKTDNQRKGTNSTDFRDYLTNSVLD